MIRSGFVIALTALLVVAAASNQQSDSKPSPSSTQGPTTSVQPLSSTTAAPLGNEANKTKEEVGKGYGHRRRNDYGDKYEGRDRKRYDDKDSYEHGHKRRYDDEDSYEYDFDHSYSKVRPYFDTHYCSVHGSFRLAYNEKVEKKSYGGDNNYQQGNSYGNQGGDYNQGGQSYGNQGSYGAPQQDYNQGGYGDSSYNQGGYGKGNGYKDKPHFVRKITRQYCRYAAAWSEKACKFCCKVVARSAYTNPDDIIAAIFSFDPASPASNGYGIEKYDHHKDKDYNGGDSYGQQDGGYGNQQSGGYGGQQDYNQQNGGYGGQQNYNQGGGYGNQGGNSYDQQAQYGNGPYRSKRNVAGYSPAPTYGANNDYNQTPADQYQQTDQYSATPDAYSQKPDYGNKYENNPNAINQCVCCAPKHRYW